MNINLGNNTDINLGCFTQQIYNQLLTWQNKIEYFFAFVSLKLRSLFLFLVFYRLNQIHVELFKLRELHFEIELTVKKPTCEPNRLSKMSLFFGVIRGFACAGVGRYAGVAFVGVGGGGVFAHWVAVFVNDGFGFEHSVGIVFVNDF